jgi:thiol-disulfide isomerase/thioredoxin
LSQKLRHLFILAVALLLGAPSFATTNVSSSPVKAAPVFVKNDLHGKKVDLAGYRGHVVLLNFWATWCAPCLTEMPRFVEWQKVYGGKGLQILGVSMDDEVEPVRKMDQKLQLNYPVVMGDEKLGDSYGGVMGLPITFVIDRAGKIRFQHKGLTDLKQLEGEVKSLL